MISTTNLKDVLDDVLLLSYSDYIANESNDSLNDSVQIDNAESPPHPPSRSANKSIIKSNFTNIVFCDYVNSNESADSLEAHFQKSFDHSFCSSSIGRLEEWKKQQSY
ncbi:hypothetical protein CL6EHI_124540 [Entamoeba histolytica]|uniref:Uncharacterized protein n=6 Tax=Entamoeba TaxID=5758 RepID=C4LZI9_ENTH1|nr:uncharacterized protein EDI_023980 [Entamoeba dispar SAW760]XP_008855358.1 hypothetical protein ENU1_025440 [Entamoeba nuttalli P19]XP_654871.1 hypothetical protein EHI_124540 [Entamoeba histolytica HM-1:IMSS]EMD45578.1 Hypothetical protein EHI5A_260650 [Entamoeba histolytica KU27]GAT94285.1 hypothetical protein CL6EHI_124540 [Entamoeba histolytica]EAL49484.1 hypothetical protein EHI_124540 [Entamoeba histolytica HM-1:IMSS]EDR26114.1 hypothetical protein EDI_023980 [Entamoeba dispar SAW760|eukprot:EDR26114.1 hypothetical protein EDI_023980 [Entamoeba dispar SAW760]